MKVGDARRWWVIGTSASLCNNSYIREDDDELMCDITEEPCEQISCPYEAEYITKTE